MEILCNAVKENECWDFENEECKDIAKAVDLSLNRFVGYMHEYYPKLRVSRLFRGGSMEEKTRLLRTREGDIEFDYLVVIDTWPDTGSLRFKHSCTGCMNIEYDVGDPSSSSGDKRNVGRICSAVMMTNMLKAVSKRCKLNFCTSTVKQMDIIHEYGNDVDDLSSSECSACTTYLTTGSLTIDRRVGSKPNSKPLEFLWNRKHLKTTYDGQSSLGKDFTNPEYKLCSVLYNPMVDIHQDGIRITIDFHPAFELNRENIIHGSDGQASTELPSDDTHVLYLFPKGTAHCSHSRHNANCWRISTIAHELTMIKLTTPEHRYAYMTLKFLTTSVLPGLHSFLFNILFTNEPHTYRISGGINRFVIKTIFLHHIDKCHQPDRDVKECVTEMLKDLLIHFSKTEYLPHFHLKYKLYPNSTPELAFLKHERHTIMIFTHLESILRMPNAHSNMSDIAMDIMSMHLIPDYKMSDVQSESDCNRQHYLRRFEQFIKARETRTAEEVFKTTASGCVTAQSYGNIDDVGLKIPIRQRINEYLKNEWEKREREQELERNEERKRHRVEKEHATEADIEDGKKMKTE